MPIAPPLRGARLGALAALAAALASPAPAAADTLRASILAGTGALGIHDGPGASATFMAPTQVAIDKGGSVYVTDSAAQRVRKIDAAGVVTTVAGGGEPNASGMWVDGGYAEGPAAQARFNDPDGIAIAKDGAIVVADRDNHCLRAIANGAVSLFAGSPQRSGALDGPRASASFTSPRQLAADVDGTLYVADWGAGVRKIASDGTVSTLHVPGVTFDRPTGVAIGHSGPSVSALFVADAAGLVRVDLPSLHAVRVDAFPPSTDAPNGASVSSDAPLGVPHSVAALDVGDVVFSDVRDSAVKYLRVASFVRYLGTTPAENAMLTGGGPEFDPAAPTYDDPMGVAVDAKGATYVADTGNRRIERIAPFDTKHWVTDGDLSRLAFSKSAYRIAVVGSSFTWWASDVDGSIAGRLAADLASVDALRATPPETRYFQTNLHGEFDLMDAVLSAGTADAVVLLISPTDPYGLDLGSAPAAWTGFVRSRVTKTAATLASAHVPFLVVVVPAAETLSPLESPDVFQGLQADPRSDYDAEHQAMLAALRGIDVPMLDLYPAARAEIAGPGHRPLFNTANVHYSPYGRAFVARAVAARLRELAPWSAKR